MLISVAGHLILVAIMITSFALVIDRAKTVVPDRIEIIEIDLNTVKVSGTETKLRNINADAKPEPESKPEPAPTPVEPSPEPVETPSVVENNDMPADTPTDNPKPKKTVIRVNREVLSIDRTLTVSVADALRVAMTRCWVIDTARPGLSDIRAVAHLTMRKNGTVSDVWFEGAAAADTDPAFAYVLETIRNAINACQPFRMLPENEYENWRTIRLTFYPTQGKVI